MKEEVKKILKDRLLRDILVFFYENQTSIDTPEGVSVWVSNDVEEVRSALERLLEQGVLAKDLGGATEGYCYTRNEKTMNIIESLMCDV